MCLVSDALLLSLNFSTDTDTKNDMKSSNDNQAASSTPYEQTALNSNDCSVVLNPFYKLLATANSIFETMNAVASGIFESGDHYLNRES